MKLGREAIINLLLLQVAVIGPLALAGVDLRAVDVIPWIACVLQLAVSRQRERDAKALAMGALIGGAAEWGASLAGLVEFTAGTKIGSLPIWVPGQWAMLATALGYALRPLQGRPVLTTILGAIASYGALIAAAAVGLLTLPGLVQWLVAALVLGLALGMLAQLTRGATAERRSAG